jgi:hypothetical protein
MGERRRDRLAAELQAEGLELIHDLADDIGVDPFAMRVVLEYAGIPWRFEATGVWTDEAGDESDAPEVWVEPWVAALVYGLAICPGAPEAPTIKTVGAMVECAQRLGAMVRSAVLVLTEEQRAALLAVEASCIASERSPGWVALGAFDYSAVRDFLVAVGAASGGVVRAFGRAWDEAQARVRAAGDWRPDDGGVEF